MIGASLPQEREVIGRIAAEVGVFDEAEIATVLELFDDYARDAEGSGYFFRSYREAGRLLGFACFGPTPITQGTFDLYWICTARDAQKVGVGRALFRHVEDEVRASSGRLIVIATESGEQYAAARAFYERMGCALDGIVRDYYRPGADLYMYTRRVEQV